MDVRRAMALIGDASKPPSPVETGLTGAAATALY